MKVQKLEQDLELFTISYAQGKGIPPQHFTAVVERVRASLFAVNHIDEYTPLFERLNKQNDLVVVNSLDGLQEEIDGRNKSMIRHVVDKAALDYNSGILERRCE